MSTASPGPSALTAVAITPEVTVSPHLSPSATATSQATFTSTAEAVELRVSQNANCRKGPGVAYDALTSFSAGTSLAAIGRNADSTWWNVNVPRDGTCFISHTTVDVRGPTDLLPVLTPLPLPEAPSTFDDSPVCIKSSFEVKFTWTDVVNETGYRIYRNGGLIATLGANRTKYSDLPPFGQDLEYQLAAFNENGESDRLITDVSACP